MVGRSGLAALLGVLALLTIGFPVPGAQASPLIHVATAHGAGGDWMQLFYDDTEGLFSVAWSLSAGAQETRGSPLEPATSRWFVLSLLTDKWGNAVACYATWSESTTNQDAVADGKTDVAIGSAIHRAVPAGECRPDAPPVSLPWNAEYYWTARAVYMSDKTYAVKDTILQTGWKAIKGAAEATFGDSLVERSGSLVGVIAVCATGVGCAAGIVAFAVSVGFEFQTNFYKQFIEHLGDFTLYHYSTQTPRVDREIPVGRETVYEQWNFFYHAAGVAHTDGEDFVAFAPFDACSFQKGTYCKELPAGYDWTFECAAFDGLSGRDVLLYAHRYGGNVHQHDVIAYGVGIVIQGELRGPAVLRVSLPNEFVDPTTNEVAIGTAGAVGCLLKGVKR
jgi:hypothetical protein